MTSKSILANIWKVFSIMLIFTVSLWGSQIGKLNIFKQERIWPIWAKSAGAGSMQCTSCGRDAARRCCYREVRPVVVVRTRGHGDGPLGICCSCGGGRGCEGARRWAAGHLLRDGADVRAEVQLRAAGGRDGAEARDRVRAEGKSVYNMLESLISSS